MIISAEARRIARQFIRADPRNAARLETPWHDRSRQHPGRREHIYGRVHAMNCRCEACRG